MFLIKSILDVLQLDMGSSSKIKLPLPMLLQLLKAIVASGGPCQWCVFELYASMGLPMLASQT
jgi:hypothetical protein